MTLTEKHLRKLAKELLDREREMVYGESCSEDQRVTVIEKFIVEQEKRLYSNDSKKAER